MKYILLLIAMVMIVARVHWYVRVKGVKSNWLRYCVFSIISSVILAVLHMNTYNIFDGDIRMDELISLSAIFTAYIVLFILYPILRHTIDKYSN